MSEVDGISANKYLTSNQRPGFFVNSDRLINAINPAVITRVVPLARLIDEFFSYRIIMNISNSMQQRFFFNDVPVISATLLPEPVLSVLLAGTDL